MSLLLHCPRCGFTYVRPREHLGQMITCSSCKCEFTAEPPSPKPELPLPAFAPIIVSSFPGDILIEPEPVHDVDHIEVIEEPPPKSETSPLGSLELGPAADEIPTDQVEVVEPPDPRRKKQSVFAVAEGDIVLEPNSERPLAPAAVADRAEVLMEASPKTFEEIVEPVAVALRPAVDVGEVVADTPRDDRPVPMRRRSQASSLDIRKRPPGATDTPAGVWIGVGAGFFALVILVVILVAALKSGADPAAPRPQAGKDQPPPAAAPIEQHLPAKDEWPPSPDRRGTAPWKPLAPKLKEQIPSAKDLGGLVGYWPLDEGQGEQAADASDHRHKSTLVGGWWIDGVRGKALLFDGRRDYLDLGPGPQLNFPANGPFTVAGWMATRQQDGYVLALRTPRDFAPTIQVKLNGGSLSGVVRADGSESGEARVGLAPVADGRWHHFALVRHPVGMIECYLDGHALDKRMGASTQGPISTTLRTVGCERSWFLSQQNPAAYCACAIDELCIFNRALTSQEIAALAGR